MAPGEIAGQRRRNARKRGGEAPRDGKLDSKTVTKKGKGRNLSKNPPPGKGKKNKQFPEGAPPKNAKPTKKQQQKGKKTKPAREVKKPLTADELEKQMDDYWLKSKDKAVASKKLDEDMDSYWAKKEEEEKEGEHADAAEETKGDEKEEVAAES